MRRLPVLLVFLAALGVPALGRAQEDPRAVARRHYEQGVALSNAADYAGALEQFQQAYAKSPNYAVLYNIGQAEAVLGHLLQAIAALSRYLKDGGAEIPESRREEVKAQLAALEARLAELTITTEHTGATVRVDGRDLGRTPLYEPIRLAPGRHVIVLSDGERTQTTTVELREGERRTLTLTLPEAAPKPEEPPRAAPETATGVGAASGREGRALGAGTRPSTRTEPSTSTSTSTGARAIVAYGVAGAGVAMGAGALGHYLWNRGRYGDWKRENAALQADRFAPDYRERQLANNELAESIERGSRVSVTLAVAAGALATTGVVLLLTDSNGHDTKGSRSGVSFAWTGGRGGAASAWTAW